MTCALHQRPGVRAQLAAGLATTLSGVVFALFSALGAAGAQSSPSLPERLDVSGALRMGHWSSTREVNSTNPQFGGLAWLKATPELTSNLSGFVEGWAALRGPADHPQLALALREAYVDVRVGRLDARVGRQIIAWGRADGINPTDNLTPRDFTMLVPDDYDRRVGSTGLRASWYEGDVSLSALWLPEFQPNRLPLPVTPGCPTFRETYDRWPGETWGLRAERTGGAVDWSLSFMRGPDLQPDLAPGLPSDRPGAIRLEHHRVAVAGADAAMNVGRFGLRAEAAFTHTEDADGDDPFIRNRHLFVVLGADRTFLERLNVNVQYLSRHVVDLAPALADTGFASGVAASGAIMGSQVARSQHGTSARVRHSWHNETLAAELSSIAWFGPRGLALVPKASYAIRDGGSTVLGGEIYRGERRSTFGLLRPNSVAYAEVRLAF